MPIRNALKVGGAIRALSARAIGAKEECQDELCVNTMRQAWRLIPDNLSLWRQSKNDLPAKTDDGSFGP
jgi:hypothetical protein